MRTIKELILHCTATQEGVEVSVERVNQWHQLRGFRCIGYHFLIGLHGEVWKGRPVEEIGAHCTGHNQNSIGICYVGGCDKNMRPKDTRTPEQKQALKQLVNELKKQYPEATVHGHNEFANKACPCFDVKKEFGKQ
jgi:N-acetylmuramoyl-L-alanine amidase